MTGYLISPSECPHCLNNDGVPHDHWVTAAPEAPSEPPTHATNSKTAALMLVEHIEELARVALSPAAEKVLDPEEGTELRRSLKRLRPTFDDLAKWFVEPLRETKPSRADYGYEKLLELMTGCFVVGSRATRSKSVTNAARPIVKRAVRREIKKETWSVHMAKIRAKIAPKPISNDSLDAAIVDEVTERKRKFSASIEFAGLIRAGVMARLELPRAEYGWPSNSTIRGAIIRIKSYNAVRAVRKRE